MNLLSSLLFYSALFFYTLTAYFFLRLFVWKRYSEYFFWKKRPFISSLDLSYLARHQQSSLPFFSILVPARDESLVIDKTISNLTQMEYSPGFYEIVIITDEREEIAFLKDKKSKRSTTAQIAREWQKKCLPDGPRIKVLTVPLGFDGRFNGSTSSEVFPSTKGRALNYALSYLDERSQIVGFYDAESRPDHKTFLYVAHEYLIKKENMSIMQGPLFQVRNFYRLGPVSRLGGLFKAVSHDWYLPVIFKSLPFVGGTHFYASRNLIDSIQGFNLSALTEDLDFGVRAYQYNKKRVEFLPLISTEQTPPLFRQFFQQRLRWASGHLQVMTALKKNDPIFWNLFFKGPFEWLLYQGAAMTVIGLNLLLLSTRLGWIPASMIVFPLSMELIFGLLNIPYFVFSYYCFRRYAFTYDRDQQLSHIIPGIDLIRIISSSLLVFLLPLPYTYAICLHFLRKKPLNWVKTARTAE
jgi:cellulose synthase/poly-beta-1,6-N-acetylglucosamine synthase-like glycosyltransferase